MGRFETLKPETQDMVNAILPAIASSFKIDPENCKDIIPEDIRMRQWDCERRDHIKDKPEDEPRNWGVEFLKSLQAIARLNGSDLGAFQERLRELVAKHAEKHPWARLEDVRQIKAEYQNPALRDPNGQERASESSSDDSLDSYLEELVDQELPKGTKRGRNEAYESRVQGWWKAAKPKKPKKSVRLRRDPIVGWDRRGKDKSKSRDVSQVSDGSDTPDAAQKDSRRRTTSKQPTIKEESPTVIHSTDEDSDDDVPVEVKKLQAELEAAEAELEVSRKRFLYLEAVAKAKSAKSARGSSASSMNVPSQNSRNSVNSHTDYNSYDGSIVRNGHHDHNGFTGFTGFGGPQEHHGFRGFNGFTGFNGHSTYPLQANYIPRQDSQTLPALENYAQDFDEAYSEEDIDEEETEEDIDEEDSEEDIDEEDSEDDENNQE